MLFAAPVICLPMLLIQPASAGRTAWVTGVMAILWATEAIPMAVTALLPLVLFPCLGVLPADRVSRNYFADKIVLFFGGLIIAAALEAVGLHRRMALRVLLTFGTRPPRLLLGFMCATAFLSMWMSNTATAAMMMPIVEAVILHLEAEPPPQLADEKELAPAAAEVPPATEVPVAHAPRHRTSGARRSASELGKALVLGVAYGANIGGMSTLTGTGPNVILAGQFTGAAPAAFEPVPRPPRSNRRRWPCPRRGAFGEPTRAG